MEIIELKTLIDITNTGVRRLNQGSVQEFEQHKNFVTLTQCIEMSSVISYDMDPEVEEVDLKDFKFGKKYKGKHKVWTWRFYPDREGAFNTDELVLGQLLANLDRVPVIKNLTETINIDRPVFELTDPNLKNTTVKIFSGNQ